MSEVDVPSHFTMKGLAIALAGTAILTVMIFTLPDIIGLELTIAMMATLSVLMGMYVILITEIIHRTSLALIGACLLYTSPSPRD